MADVTELLSLAGRDGGRELDLDAVQSRATTLQRRERALRVAAIAAAVAVVVPLTQLRGGNDALEQQPAGPTRPVPSVLVTSSAPAPTAAPLRDASPAPQQSARTSAGPESSPPSAPTAAQASSASGSHQAVPAPTSGAAPAGDFPARQSCQVSATALGPGQQSSCQFTATVRGGWYFENGMGAFVDYENHDAAAEVLVQRGGGSTRYVVEDITCMDDVVRPGDRVTVLVRQSQAGGYSDFQLGAGGGFDCSTPRVRPEGRP